MEPIAAVESVRYVHIVLLTLFLREAQEPGLKKFHSLIKRGKSSKKKATINSSYFSLCLLLDYLELVAHRNIWVQVPQQHEAHDLWHSALGFENSLLNDPRT